ncbi:MAG: SDR family oxidoreductase [Ilumatobacteraceae bacterium]|jgi:NAD(P)-dependent dehydrogenase (short-subunit alcohol dehydrogenase family)|nr:SDR family oxidoreductase [Ilumatobacteraceae bacterium]
MGDLEGKVAIVTGAGRGIGKATAKVYAREGAKVVVASRTAATVQSVTAEIIAEGNIALGVVADVSSKEDIFRMVAETVQQFGTVDILVNNAQGFGTAAKPRGSTIPTPMEDTDDEEWEYTFRTGATATLWAMQAVFPYMKEHGGRIINFSSGSGMEGFPGNTPYNATKEAIRALTRTAAREWGKYAISVNTVNPSLRTDAWENWEASNQEFVQGLKDKMPLGFLGDPEEHGGPWMVWLAGKGGDYVTGMTIFLNGGRYMP